MKRVPHALSAPSACLVALVGLVACDGGGATTDDAQITYRRDGVALLNRYCNECHQAGGIAPFALTSYESARDHAELIRGALMSRTMPPWMPSDAGVPLANSRKMRDEDRATLLRWIDTGMKEGAPTEQPRTDLPPAPNVTPPRADLVLKPGAMYQPKQGRSDDYHCFVMDPKFTEDMYLRAAIVRPDNKAIVHHVLVFEIEESALSDLQKKDDAEPGEGYTCYGGPGVGTRSGVTTVTGWAPGGTATRFSDEVGIRVRARSKLVVQMHYNLMNYKGVGDQSEVVFELSRTPPKRVAQMLPIARPDQLKIKAGDTAARQDIAVPVGLLEGFLKWPLGEITVWGNAPHMHQLGTRIATSVEDGPMLVEIPRWDFHWQGGYTLATPYVLRQSDTIHVECQYDNGPANQPVVDGMRQPPRDVTWGENTTDEMCLSYLLATPGGL